MTNVIPLFPEHPVSHPSRGLSGVWWLRDGMVFVRSEHVMKPTQIGGASPESLAMLMLRELADEADPDTLPRATARRICRAGWLSEATKRLPFICPPCPPLASPNPRLPSRSDRVAANKAAPRNPSAPAAQMNEAVMSNTNLPDQHDAGSGSVAAWPSIVAARNTIAATMTITTRKSTATRLG